MDVNDKTIQALSSSLNFRQMRQKILSSNISNAETPGFKAKRLDFESALSRALDIEERQRLRTDNDKHFNVGGGGFDNLEPRVYKDPNGVVSEDGNTVDREQEMAKMAENEILYNASVQLMNKKLGLKKYILNSER